MSFDPPTRSGRTTARPPSQPDEDAEIIDLDGDARALLGKVMASQAKLVKSQRKLEESHGRIESGWDARSRDHETAMRELTAFGKCIRDLREDVYELTKNSKKTSRHVKQSVPAVLVVIEIGRAILHHYGFG